MWVKVFVVVAIVRETGEICGRYPPTGINVKRSSSRPAFAYLRRNAGAAAWPEIDPNSGHSRSYHGVVSATIHIERRAVRGATFVDGDTTSLVAVDSCIAVGTGSSSVIGWFQNIDS